MAAGHGSRGRGANPRARAPMRGDMEIVPWHRRIHWSNVTRLAVALAAVALVAAWPRLTPAPPGVPARAAPGPRPTPPPPVVPAGTPRPLAGGAGGSAHDATAGGGAKRGGRMARG